ncbi:MAG: hypothetical protein AAF416_18535 [Pseudomonadota bacterium]
MRRTVSFLALLTVVAGCQSRTEPIVTTTSDAAQSAPQSSGAVVMPFRFVDEGSLGTLTVNGTTARYEDEYCGGMSTDAGVLEGSTITFDRMTYPECGKPEALWADIVITGYKPETGCFDQLRFKWGYNFVKTYYAYPTDDACRES